jgi:hypothetical protein
VVLEPWGVRIMAPRMYDWLSIPALGDRFQIDLECTTILLRELGFRWKVRGQIMFRDDIFRTSIARRITPAHGHEVVQWNLLAIRAILNGTYPAEGWAEHAECAERLDLARRLPF